MSLDDVVSQVEEAGPDTVDVKVLLDARLLREHRELSEQFARQLHDDDNDSIEGHSDGTRQIAEQLRDLEAKMDAARVLWRFANIGYAAWSDLLKQHPPTDEDRKAGFDYNRQTFPPAAMAASVVEPDPGDNPAGKFRKLRKTVNVQQWDAIWTACLRANRGSYDTRPFVAATAILRGTRPNVTTPTEPQGSPGRS